MESEVAAAPAEATTEAPRVKLTKAEKKAIYRKDYPEPLKTRRELLKAAHLENDQNKIQNLMFSFFEEDLANDKNIFGSAVDHFKAMPDKTRNNENSLAGSYLRNFQIWINARNDVKEMRLKFLTREIKVEAHKSCSGSSFYLDYMMKIFDLDTEDLIETVKLHVKEKLSKMEYKEAAEFIIIHKLTSSFTFEEVVLPLILQDRLITVYEYIQKEPKMQKQFIKWHDDLIGKEEMAIERELDKWKNVMTVKPSKFVGKTLDKYMNSIFNKIAGEYELDVSCPIDAPKFESKKQDKALRHQIGMRYDHDAKSKHSDDVYFQHVRPTLESCKSHVTENFLYYLWSSKNVEKQIDAISWVRLLKLDVESSKVPKVMRQFFIESKDRSMIQDADLLVKQRLESAVPENDKPMYLFENEEKRMKIEIVKNNAGLEHLCSELKFFEQEENDKFVGIDTEWKPAHLISSTTMKIAIMQIYFGDKVFIVDCVLLEDKKTSLTKDETWLKFANRLLCSNKLKIVGFDLRNDLDALLVMNALKESVKIEDVKNVYCLKRLTENIYDIDANILDLPKRTFKLADLTEKLLNVTLNKNEQCSNWQSRPLRKDQIVYAAMDAYVVVEVFRKILKIVREHEKEINEETCILESNVLLPKKESSKKDQKKLDTLKWAEIYEALKDHRNPRMPLKRPYEIKCIVDTMLLGFGKYLRRCGIDVIIPKDVQDFHAKLKAIKRLGPDYARYILTVPSKSYDNLMSHNLSGLKSFQDLSQKPALDQLKMFFEQFNVDLRPDDVCLRCVDCNSRYLVRFPSPVIRFLHNYMVTFLQNVYRPDMSEFPLEEKYQEMRNINPDDYDGIQVEMSRPSPDSDWIVATTSEGCLHITRNLILHNNAVDGVDVRINKVPDDTFQRPNLIFYVCGNCGKVMYDGKLVAPEGGGGAPKIGASASNSSESVPNGWY